MGRLGLGRSRGKFVLRSVEQEAYSPAVPRLLFKNGDDHLEKQDPPMTWKTIAGRAAALAKADSLSLCFLTPTRLKWNGNFVTNLEFHHLIRNLLRRLSALSYFHGEGHGTIDFKRLITDAGSVAVIKSTVEWYDWERYSNRQKTKMKMGGLTGEAHFRGDFAAFLPFLLWGELVHIGKGTSFGLGQYKILNG
jgi:CRISPR-associated endoribonuclease Cas6